MKKLFLTVSAVALIAVYALPASAECDGVYLGVRGGVVKHDVSGETSSLFDSDSANLDKERLMISGALGYRYEHWRAELEYVWRKHTNNDEQDYAHKFKSYSYMINAYYDFMPYYWISPYVGAGIGLTQLKYTAYDKASGRVDTTDGNYKPLNFTWSVGGGVSVKVTNRFNVDVGYRYYDMGGIRHADVDAQEVYGGLRYVF